MGTYLNPGKKAFEKAVNSDIYVDKTELIRYLNSIINTKQQYVSVSRPRRFGKTITVDMICAYYDRDADSRQLFSEKKLAKTKVVHAGTKEMLWDTYLGSFDVIRLTMTKFFKRKKTVSNALDDMQRLVIRDLKKAYPDVDYFDDEDLIQTIDDVYSETDRQIIIVIDEWDAVFRERQNDKDGQKEYLDFLRDLLKDNEHIALAYMTGILPIKKYGKHSALNMFTEYSMTSPKGLAEYVGFTKEDVLEICRQKNLNYDLLKEWYDGYRISNKPSDELIDDKTICDDLSESQIYEIYCPLSVVSAALYKKLESYWNKTETYEALAEYIRKDYDGLKESVALLMDGGKLKIDTSSYQNDMTSFTCRDDVLSLLIHLGYLGYDDETSEVFIPNKEIMDEFHTSTKSDEWIPTFKSFELSVELLKATWNEEVEKVADIIEKMHDKADNRTYNDEAALSYAIRMAYYAAQKYYTLIPETDSGKGYADLICIPSPKFADKPALVIELKYNKNAEGAIFQIKNRNYPERLEHYKDNILLVGINYDKDVPNTDPEFKHHSCVIEKSIMFTKQ